MLRTAFVVAAVLAVSAVSSPVTRQAKTACFITGTATLPSDVSVDTSVQCDTSATETFKGVPEVTRNGQSFSDISFTKDTSVSSVGFALKTFPTPDDPTTGNVTDFENAQALYGATNAGLRSLGADAPSGALNELKGVNFFLDFQITRIKQDNGTEGTAHKLDKVLKNCAGCSAGDRQAVIALAASSGIDVTGKS